MGLAPAVEEFDERSEDIDSALYVPVRVNTRLRSGNLESVTASRVEVFDV
jgi:hypothetical protein